MSFAVALAFLMADAGANPFDKFETDTEFAALFKAWQAQDQDPAVAWSILMNDGTTYHALRSEIRRDSPFTGGITLWIRGSHPKSAGLNYRRSLWNITLDCQGRMRYNASTQLTAEGKTVEDSDIQSPWLLVRPDTLFQSAERTLCGPK